jgi:hypothetical protein
MTAPPAMQMPLPTFDPYLNIASTFISPSTITSDSSFSWVTMPPHQEPSREYKFLRFSLIIDMVRHIDYLGTLACAELPLRNYPALATRFLLSLRANLRPLLL